MTRRTGRIRKLLAAVLATLAATATLVPALATPAAAASTSISFRNCASMTVGTKLTCTVRVTHSASNDPTGTVTVSISSSGITDAEVLTANSRCTLVGQSGGNRSDCNIDLTAWSTGTLTISANYASSNTSSFSNSSGSNNITVGEPSSFGIALSLKSLRDLAVGSTSSASAGSSSSDVSFAVKGYACPAGTSAYELVTGAASGTPSDPTTAATPQVLGPFSVTAGDFVYSVTIPTNHPTGVFRGSFVCATSVPTRASSSGVQSASPALQMSITSTTGGTFSAFSRSADDDRVVLGTFATPDDDEGTGGRRVELSVDPDDLNPVDNVNIVKQGADLLKARVDSLLPASSVVSRTGYTLVEDGVDRAQAEKWTSEVAAGRADAGTVAAALAALPAAAPLMTAPTDEFVGAVYQRALGRAASSGELAAAVAALDAGRTSRAALVAVATSSPESAARWRSRSYVAAAFQALTARIPTDGELGRFVGELDGGGYKVNMVEAVALLGATAAEWNVAAPAGRTPASATFRAPVAAAPAPVAARPPTVAPAPVAAAPAAPKATPKRRATVRRVRSAASRKVVARRTATTRKVVARRTTTTRKVVARRSATVRR